MIKRISSGIIMIILAGLFFIYSGELISQIVFFLLSVLSLYEISHIYKAGFFDKSVIILSSALFFFYGSLIPEKRFVLIFLILNIIFFAVKVIRDNIESRFIEYVSVCILSGIFPFYIMNMIFQHERRFLLSIMILVWVYDISAYFTGVSLGKRRLVPNISPKKSWEGLIGATITVYILSFIFLYQKSDITEIILLDTFIVVLAPLGDLFVSLLKRKYAVKDTGNIIPGHGGILDRMDSFVFLVPIIYYSGVFSC